MFACTWRRLPAMVLPLALSSVALAASDSVSPQGASVARASRSALITVDPPVTPVSTAAGATSRPASDGSVGRALTRLYQIPRSDARINRTPAGSVSNNGRGLQRSQNSAETRDRMGYQHSDAIRNSVSQLPIGDDLHRPAGDGHIVPRVDGKPAIPREKSMTATAWGPDIAYQKGAYREYARVPASKHEWVNYGYYGGPAYGYGYAQPNPVYVIQPPDDAGEAYYRFGFLEREYDRMEFHRKATQRTESILSHAGTQMSRGLQAFRSGQYREAAKLFKLASEMDQGDPSARIYATHALFAIGRYQEAVEYLRRAFSLEPRIAMLNYDLRDDYGRKEDFTEQLAALQQVVDGTPRDMSRRLLLGYVLNYSGQPDTAFRVLTVAVKTDASDKLAKALYEATNPPDVAVQQGKR